MQCPAYFFVQYPRKANSLDQRSGCTNVQSDLDMHWPYGCDRRFKVYRYCSIDSFIHHL